MASPYGGPAPVSPQRSRPQYRYPGSGPSRSGYATSNEPTWVEYIQDLVMDFAVCGNTGDDDAIGGTCGILEVHVDEDSKAARPQNWADEMAPRRWHETDFGMAAAQSDGPDDLCRSNLQGGFSLAGMQTIVPQSLKTRPDRQPPLSLPSFSSISQGGQPSPMYHQGRNDSLLTTSQGVVDIDMVISAANGRKPQQNAGQRGFMEPLSVSDSTAAGSTVGSIGRSTVGSIGSHQGSDMQVLQVLLGDGQGWRPLRFHRTDDLTRRAETFIEEFRLSPLVKPGLVTQMRQMVMMRQLSASVDVVDLF